MEKIFFQRITNCQYSLDFKQFSLIRAHVREKNDIAKIVDFDIICHDFVDTFFRIFIEILIIQSDFVGFAMVFDGLDLRAERELDKKSGHFLYLLVLKRSFLSFSVVQSVANRSRFSIKVRENYQNPGLEACTAPVID